MMFVLAVMNTQPLHSLSTLTAGNECQNDHHGDSLDIVPTASTVISGTDNKHVCNRQQHLESPWQMYAMQESPAKGAVPVTLITSLLCVAESGKQHFKIAYTGLNAAGLFSTQLVLSYVHSSDNYQLA